MSVETEQIKDRLDIADIVGEYVQLKKNGRHFKGLCPFHQEKTPSFIVSPDKGIWHCFGACAEGGDVFSFVEKIEGLDFPATLKLLAERAGVELKKTVVSKQSQSRRQRLYELLELSTRFYHELLMNQKVGKKARDYLKKRGVLPATMQKFQIGYAPKSWDTLQNFLRARGFSPQEMAAAGAVGVNDQGKTYDRFRGRIMFPIADLQGRVVAFGGRIAPWQETGEEGKYVNSPETELYEKRRIVYNLERAKQHLRHATPCIVVEGYMDVVMLVQCGVENVVASSGTAFTEEQIKQLKRYVDELHFAFDGDAAGLKAAIAATRGALAAGLRVGTVMFAKGQDPAEVAQKSPDKLVEYLAKPKSLVTVLLDQVKAADGGRAQEEILEQLLPLVATVHNPVYQGELVQELSAALHVPESSVLSQLSELRIVPVNGSDEVVEERNLTTAEEYLLGLMMGYPKVRAQWFSQIKGSFILDPNARALYNEMQGLAKDDKRFASMTAEVLLDSIPSSMMSYSEGLRQLSQERLERSDAAPSDEVAALWEMVRRHYWAKQLEGLQQRLVGGSKQDKEKALRQFLKATQALAEIDSVK